MKQYQPQWIRKPIYLVMAAVTLAGCKSVSPDYTRPDMELPAQYGQSANAGELQIASDWWTLYQDATLNALISKAQQNNKDIKFAIARIEEADAYAREVGAFILPQVNLEGAGARSRISEAGAFPVFFDNPRNHYNAQLTTNFELDFWGKLRRAKESARAQAYSSRYAKDTVALSLAGLVANNYLAWRSFSTQMAIAQDNLKSREESLALTQRRLDGGVASALDVHQAEVSVANLRAQLTDLERQRALNLHQLAVLTGDLNLITTGIAQSSSLNSLPIPPVPPAGLPSALLEARPDVKQAEALMIAANANMGVAKAALYPTISLTGNLGAESLELGDILKSAARIWTFGLNLYLPIFDSGKINAKIDQASAKQKQALANYEGAVQSAFKEVNDALVNLRQSTEKENALANSSEAAKKALAIAENRYKAGYSAYMDVLDAQRSYHDARLAFVQARQARLSASVDLFKVLGGGWVAGN